MAQTVVGLAAVEDREAEAKDLRAQLEYYQDMEQELDLRACCVEFQSVTVTNVQEFVGADCPSGLSNTRGWARTRYRGKQVCIVIWGNDL